MRLAPEGDSAEPDVLRRIGEKRHEARTLQRDREASLMMGACAGLAPRLDFRPIGQIPPQAAHILVVNMLHLVDAELTDPPPWRVAATTAAALGRAAWPLSWAPAAHWWSRAHALRRPRSTNPCRRALRGPRRLLRCRYCRSLLFAQYTFPVPTRPPFYLGGFAPKPPGGRTRFYFPGRFALALPGERAFYFPPGRLALGPCERGSFRLAIA